MLSRPYDGQLQNVQNNFSYLKKKKDIFITAKSSMLPFGKPDDKNWPLLLGVPDQMR